MASPSAPVVSGWLRKRPRVSGHWSLRFVQLSSTGVLSIFASDEGEGVESTMALLSVVIPRSVQVDDVYDRTVRAKRNGIAGERVFVIRAKFKDQVLFTLGAATKDEAVKWKQHIEQASGQSTATAATATTQGGGAYETGTGGTMTTRSRHSSMVPDSWKQDQGLNWQVVDELDGMIIESADEANQYPSLRGKCEVRGSPAQVFALLLNNSNTNSLDDDAFTTCRVLKTISPTSDIVYMQTKDIWLGPVQTGPRDLVLLRYWRRDDGDVEDGDFVITWQSIEDAALKLNPKGEEGFTRGRIFSMSVHVTPLGSGAGGRSVVRIHCHADPGGALTYMPLSVLTSWLTPFVTRVLNIERALDDKHVRRKSVAEPHAVDLDEDDTPAPVEQQTRSASSNAGVTPLKLGSWNAQEWMETPSSEPFMVRGRNYLKDRVKTATGNHMFNVVCADLNRVARSELHCAARSDSPLGEIQSRFPDRQVFVLSFILPGPPHYILAIYAVSKPGVLDGDKEETAFSRVYNNFVEGSDKYRNSCFKMIARVTKGSYVVRKAVGETPTLLGQKIKTHYFVGKNYIEVDVDLNSSNQAGTLTGIFKGYGEVSDMAILLEGHAENELPEEVVFSFRMIKPSLAGATPLGEDPNPELTKQRRTLADRREDAAADEHDDE